MNYASRTDRENKLNWYKLRNTFRKRISMQFLYKFNITTFNMHSNKNL
jgi:hypothetical protein